MKTVEPIYIAIIRYIMFTIVIIIHSFRITVSYLRVPCSTHYFLGMFSKNWHFPEKNKINVTLKINITIFKLQP